MARLLMWGFCAALAGGLLVARAARAAPGATLPRELSAEPSSVAVRGAEEASGVTPEQLWYAVGVELAQRGLQLAELGLRLELTRDASGEWFARIVHRQTGCEATRGLGRFDALSSERARSIAFEVTALIEQAGCAVLPRPASPSDAAGAPVRVRLAPWVRPAAGVYAGLSGLALLAISQTEPPNLSLSLAHAPSALATAGLSLGALGGTAALVVPESAARPTLELSVFASGGLLLASLGMAPEPGTAAYGYFAPAVGYGATAALVALDFALSEPRAMLEGSQFVTEDELPRRRLSPWVVYAPALAGSLVGMAPALSGSFKQQETALGLGTVALVPAATALVLGLVSSQRESDREPDEIMLAPGPGGSFGLTLAGKL